MLTTAVFGAPKLHAEDGGQRTAGGNQGMAKNVIFMVSDGMCHGALSMAHTWRALHGEKPTNWMRLYRERPCVRALMETASASSIVTDSAAAASAWGSGQRVANGTINVDATGKLLEPLHAKLKRSGRKLGLVSTATITHATPAGFAANVDNRGKEENIAVQYLKRGVDVLLGGGRKFFPEDLIGKFKAAGYDYATDATSLQGLANSAGKPLLGLFKSGHIPFEIDRLNVPELKARIPTLAEMSRAALQRLAGHKEGFFLMIEGARIDHAGHANDAAASLHDQLAFDDALGAVVEWIDKNPDTLLIVTTDHGCGGIQMNGVSANANQGFAPGLYNATNASLKKLAGFRRSVEWMQQEKVDGLSGPKLGDAIREFTGMELDAEKVKAAQGLKAPYTDMVKAATGVGWTSGNHTGELVEFCATGPGSHLFPPFVENREVHDHLLRAMEIS